MAATKLCLTVQADTMADLVRRRDEAIAADLLELRLDGVVDPDVPAALANRRLPAIITCRPTWEGGRFDGPESVRLALLRHALESGAEFVDVEWRASHAELIAVTGGARIVLSSHDFDQCPQDLADRVRAMLGTGAEVVKVAVRAGCLSDCLTLLDTARAVRAPGRLVLIGMGECGIVTRVCAAKFGAAWCYAGRVAGVGQLDAPTLLGEYRFRTIGPSTEIYGVIGMPVTHSVSPAMHNAAFADSGRDAVYLPLPAADVNDAVDFVRGMGMKGASITIPYKVAVLPHLNEVDAAARHVGAVNTLRVVEGRWQGANTDVVGFLRPLEERGVVLAGRRASVLGAGGSSRAVVAGLVRAGATVTLHARTVAKAREVASALAVTVGPWPPEAGSWDLLVNCTPVGMYPATGETPIAADLLTGRIVYDLVYNPIETRLLREAAQAGCETIGGLDMLVAQAREQSQWWTGSLPAAEVMRRAATRRLREFMSPWR